MQTPLQLTIRDAEHPEALEMHIRAKVGKLKEFFKHITSGPCGGRGAAQAHHHDKQINVRIDIGAPGSEVVVKRASVNHYPTMK